MKSLLEKTRLINKLLQKSAGLPVDFDDMTGVLSEIIDANVYIAGKEGEILGYSLSRGYKCDTMCDVILRKERFPEENVKRFLAATETEANREVTGSQCVFRENVECQFKSQYVTLVPINGAGNRLGTLILASFTEKFDEEDLILAEYGATLVGMEILRSLAEQTEAETRRKAAVQIVLGTLSYSELEAIDNIFRELDGTEGLLVASKIADQVGITRSVIVNALRKLESAGVIESKSLGMKGTYIKIINDKLLEEIDKLRL
jgi:transcriptional pleiotropic repressor